MIPLIPGCSSLDRMLEILIGVPASRDSTIRCRKQLDPLKVSISC